MLMTWKFHDTLIRKVRTLKKSRNYNSGKNNKCCEHNMALKLIDSEKVNNQDRMSLLLRSRYSHK